MSKHTPGPWNYRLEGNELVIEKAATHFPEWGGDGPGQTATPAKRIAVACKFEMDQTTRYLNARLIAAAPELLETLEAVQLGITTGGKAYPTEASLDKVRDLVASAILKAKGEVLGK